MSPSKKLEKNLRYAFKNQAFLEEAVTHRSFLNEHPGKNIAHNERLEFLGDAVLELAVTEDLYGRFPQYNEGTLTSLRAALVNYQMLASVARALSLEEFMRLSKGEAKDVGRAREVILANAFEAVTGAIYEDGGYSSAKAFVLYAVMPRLEDVLKEGSYKDAKSALQEKVQANSRVTPAYRLLEEKGPDHDKVFTMGVYVGETLIAQGTGPSKQEAETEAAKNALKTL
jgi:ribonuclease-3